VLRVYCIYGFIVWTYTSLCKYLHPSYIRNSITKHRNVSKGVYVRNVFTISKPFKFI